VKIGLVAPFEGLHRPLGYEALFAVKLALQERNQAGGLKGYQVQLVALNDFDDPAEARIQGQALVTDPDVLGVVGHLSSETTLAARPVYRKADLAMIVPWTIDTSGLDPEDRTGLATVAATQARTALRLEAVAQKAGVVHMAKIAEPQINEIPPGSDALALTTDGVKAGQIILALEEAQISLPLFGQVNVGSPQVVQIAKEAANGLIFVSPGPAPTDVGAETFAEAYQTLAGFPPGPRAVLAYDATQILLDAIEQAISETDRRPTRLEVSDLITSVRRIGLSGPIAFDPLGVRRNAPMWIYQISREEYPGILLATP
jgi:branched-chain amino acid transport system substrate-binding protein